MEKSIARQIYGFSQEDRFKVHERAGNSCEFPGEECALPNTGRVNHLTGCGLARRFSLDVSSITDIETNALMLCEPHQSDLDEQERVLYDSTRT